MSLKALKESFLFPREILSLFQFQFSSNSSINKIQTIKNKSEKRCFELLFLTSRSFASVICELDAELRLPICLFYLVLRGLDTIEDDMTIPNSKKFPLLEDFHKTIYNKGWTFSDNGPNEKDRILLEEFNVVIEEFLKLKPEYQEVISDITNKMGNGMIEFAKREVETLADWDLYCHYVAGLVGHGLTRLFAVSGLEDPSIADQLELANAMGLFLQKVNIIRDYLEDFEEGRCFWPREVWSKYVDKLGDFTKPENEEKALACLAELCLNALNHAQDSLKYMSLIKNPSCFNFCAIPQVMAISTLALVFNNPDVFKTNVKIRKGLAVKLIMDATSMENIRDTFLNYSIDVINKAKPSQPLFLEYSIWHGKIRKSVTESSNLHSAQESQYLSSSMQWLLAILVVSVFIFYHRFY